MAISYLFRRLEENAAPENFLHHLFTLRPGTPEFAEQADRFRESVTLRWAVGSAPRREAELVEVPEIGFTNQPDTDPSLSSTRAWLASLSEREAMPPRAPVTTSVDEVDSVVAGVRAAQVEWSARPASERRQVLRRVADELMARHGELLVTMAHEAGKTLPEADPEVGEAVDFARWYAERCLGLERISAAEFTPLGVVAVVPPWNFPVAIPCGGVVAALAAGNGVVFKPAPETPRCAEIVAESCSARGGPTCGSSPRPAARTP